MAMRLSREATKVGLRRSIHAIAQQPPLSSIMTPPSSSTPPMVLPEADHTNIFQNQFSFIHGSMELMAVPKKKTSRHKRGIRNGPKFLKPAPVIICCKVCGRVTLPHFFCCSGIKEETGGQR